MWFNILLLLCGFAAGAILTVFVLAEAGNHSPRKSGKNKDNPEQPNQPNQPNPKNTKEGRKKP